MKTKIESIFDRWFVYEDGKWTVKTNEEILKKERSEKIKKILED